MSGVVVDSQEDVLSAVEVVRALVSDLWRLVSSRES